MFTAIRQSPHFFSLHSSEKGTLPPPPPTLHHRQPMSAEIKKYLVSLDRIDIKTKCQSSSSHVWLFPVPVLTFHISTTSRTVRGIVSDEWWRTEPFRHQSLLKVWQDSHIKPSAGSSSTSQTLLFKETTHSTVGGRLNVRKKLLTSSSSIEICFFKAEYRFKILTPIVNLNEVVGMVELPVVLSCFHHSILTALFTFSMKLHRMLATANVINYVKTELSLGAALVAKGLRCRLRRQFL